MHNFYTVSSVHRGVEEPDADKEYKVPNLDKERSPHRKSPKKKDTKGKCTFGIYNVLYYIMDKVSLTLYFMWKNKLVHVV